MPSIKQTYSHNPKYTISYDKFMPSGNYMLHEHVLISGEIKSRFVTNSRTFEEIIQAMAELTVNPPILAFSFDQIDNTFKI